MKMKKIKKSKSLTNLLNNHWIIYVDGCFFIEPGVELLTIDDLLNSWKKLVENKLILFVNKKNETDIIKLSRLKEHDYLLTEQLLKGQVNNHQKDTDDFMKKLHELYEKQI